MELVDYIAIAAILLIVGAAVFYIVRSKLRGEKCIGCPHSKQCSGRCNCSLGNSTEKTDGDK